MLLLKVSKTLKNKYDNRIFGSLFHDIYFIIIIDFVCTSLTTFDNFHDQKLCLDHHSVQRLFYQALPFFNLLMHHHCLVSHLMGSDWSFGHSKSYYFHDEFNFGI